MFSPPLLDFTILIDRVTHTLDFATPRDGAVFWSGDRKNDALAWVRDNPGHYCLGQTPGGHYLEHLDLYRRMDLNCGQATEIWDAASLRFARCAYGEVTVFASGTPRFGRHGERTWWRIEKPNLCPPRVTRIIYRKRNGDPCR